MNDIGMKLREARKSKGLTLRDVAEKTGLSYQAVGQYERGVRKVSASQLVKICSAIGIPITRIIDDQEEASFYTESLIEKPDSIEFDSQPHKGGLYGVYTKGFRVFDEVRQKLPQLIEEGKINKEASDVIVSNFESAAFHLNSIVADTMASLNKLFGDDAGKTAIWFLNLYSKLTQAGRERLIENIEDFASIPKYLEVEENDQEES